MNYTLEDDIFDNDEASEDVCNTEHIEESEISWNEDCREDLQSELKLRIMQMSAKCYMNHL